MDYPSVPFKLSTIPMHEMQQPRWWPPGWHTTNRDGHGYETTGRHYEQRRPQILQCWQHERTDHQLVIKKCKQPPYSRAALPNVMRIPLHFNGTSTGKNFNRSKAAVARRELPTKEARAEQRKRDDAEKRAAEEEDYESVDNSVDAAAVAAYIRRNPAGAAVVAAIRGRPLPRGNPKPAARKKRGPMTPKRPESRASTSDDGAPLSCNKRIKPAFNALAVARQRREIAPMPPLTDRGSAAAAATYSGPPSRQPLTPRAPQAPPTQTQINQERERRGVRNTAREPISGHIEHRVRTGTNAHRYYHEYAPPHEDNMRPLPAYRHYKGGGHRGGKGSKDGGHKGPRGGHRR